MPIKKRALRKKVVKRKLTVAEIKKKEKEKAKIKKYNPDDIFLSDEEIEALHRLNLVYDEIGKFYALVRGKDPETGLTETQFAQAILGESPYKTRKKVIEYLNLLDKGIITRPEEEQRKEYKFRKDRRDKRKIVLKIYRKKSKNKN